MIACWGGPGVGFKEVVWVWSGECVLLVGCAGGVSQVIRQADEGGGKLKGLWPWRSEPQAQATNALL